jgi:cation transport ATPase
MEKELAKVKKAEEALAKEEEKERAKAKKAEERAKAKKAEERAKALAKALAKERIDHDRESAKMCMRMKREESKRIPNSLSDDDMMTAVLQSLGHPSMIGVDLLLSIYTLWLFRATKYHRNGRLMNRLALMKSFAVEYFSIARHK